MEGGTYVNTTGVDGCKLQIFNRHPGYFVNADIRIDWLFVRNWVATEPTFGDWSSEE